MSQKLIAEGRIKYCDRIYEKGNTFLCLDDGEATELIRNKIARAYPEPSPEVLARKAAEAAKFAEQPDPTKEPTPKPIYTIKEILGSKMYLREDDMGLSKDLMEHGIREEASTEYIQNILKPNWTVIDIGANLGYYALLEARRCKFVYAIEPVKSSFETLNKSIKLNKYKNIKTFQMAISNRNGLYDIAVSKKNNWSNMVNLNLLVDAHKETLGKSFKEIQKVQTIPLDDFAIWNNIRKINFIRMDVEGYEVEIVEGMDKVFDLMPGGSYLTIEFHSILLKNREPFVKLLDKVTGAGFKVICGTWVKSKFDLTQTELRERLYRGACFQAFFKKDEK